MTDRTDTSDTSEARGATRYLDLDGDGVPDAVETLTIEVDPDRVEVVDEVDAEIDDDGLPHRVAVERVVVAGD